MAGKIDCSLYLVQMARARGYTWGQIASALNCSKVGLNLYLKRHNYQEPETRAFTRPEEPLKLGVLKCGVGIE